MSSATAEQMSFWDHLDALRAVLMRVLLVAGILAIGAFMAMPWIFDHVIMAPTSPDFPTYSLFDRIAALSGQSAGTFSVDVVSIELASQIFVHFSASCWIALIVGFPIIIYLLWGFVAPALYPEEKRGIRRAFFFGNVMFYIGVAVGYFLVFPLAVRFLATYQLSAAIRPIVSLDSYMDNFFTLLLMMGAVFELPLLAWLLGKMGTQFLRHIPPPRHCGSADCCRHNHAYGRSVHSLPRFCTDLRVVGSLGASGTTRIYHYQ